MNIADKTSSVGTKLTQIEERTALRGIFQRLVSLEQSLLRIDSLYRCIYLYNICENNFIKIEDRSCCLCLEYFDADNLYCCLTNHGDSLKNLFNSDSSNVDGVFQFLRPLCYSEPTSFEFACVIFYYLNIHKLLNNLSNEEYELSIIEITKKYYNKCTKLTLDYHDNEIEKLRLFNVLITMLHSAHSSNPDQNKFYFDSIVAKLKDSNVRIVIFLRSILMNIYDAKPEVLPVPLQEMAKVLKLCFISNPGPSEKPDFSNNDFRKAFPILKQIEIISYFDPNALYESRLKTLWLLVDQLQGPSRHDDLVYFLGRFRDKFFAQFHENYEYQLIHCTKTFDLFKEIKGSGDRFDDILFSAYKSTIFSQTKFNKKELHSYLIRVFLDQDLQPKVKKFFDTAQKMESDLNIRGNSYSGLFIGEVFLDLCCLKENKDLRMQILPRFNRLVTDAAINRLGGISNIEHGIYNENPKQYIDLIKSIIDSESSIESNVFSLILNKKQELDCNLYEELKYCIDIKSVMLRMTENQKIYQVLVLDEDNLTTVYLLFLLLILFIYEKIIN